MKAVILAAGIGSRLGKTIPKCLTPVLGDTTILGIQVEILRACGIDEIVVVVGFKKELVMEQQPDLLYLYNPMYHISNTARSLELALSAIQADDLIWLNGDVVFESGVVDAVVQSGGNAVAVDKKSCGEEEVKYSLTPTGFVAEISKQVTPATGEAVGVNKITQASFSGFLDCLKIAGDHDYFEKAMETAINRGIEFRPVDISDFNCVEIDDGADLAQARKLIENDHGDDDD
ncbi:MAG: phosphocholine cytidylyltransferase family protein [Candidatus Delongbacteria bacterium]|nr:phosphocholine cytidylyltransferase family protein [Candidatus Delongbacteria bacterium]